MQVLVLLKVMYCGKAFFKNWKQFIWCDALEPFAGDVILLSRKLDQNWTNKWVFFIALCSYGTPFVNIRINRSPYSFSHMVLTHMKIKAITVFMGFHIFYCPCGNESRVCSSLSFCTDFCTCRNNRKYFHKCLMACEMFIWTSWNQVPCNYSSLNACSNLLYS